MYQYKNINQGVIKYNKSYVGERLEEKIQRITSNKEPIKDGAPLIYTERSIVTGKQFPSHDSVGKPTAYRDWETGFQCFPVTIEHGRHTAGANVRREKGNNPDRQLRSQSCG